MCGVGVLGMSLRPEAASTRVAQADVPLVEVPVSMPVVDEMPVASAPALSVQMAEAAAVDESNAAAPSPLKPPHGLPPALSAAGWAERVGDARAVWVSVGEQRFTVYEGGVPVWSVACATAEKGTGSVMGSYQTPLGWHRVSEKMGEGAPWGQVFRSRAATREVWRPGGDTKEDLVLTRLLWLEGLEPGKNQGRNAQGKNVDSKERCIYIHGTNAEEKIGTPSSHGCVRLYNDDVIKAFEMLPVGTLVLITEP